MSPSNAVSSPGTTTAADFLAPFFTLAKLPVGLPFQRIVEIDEHAEMRPAQLSTQRVDNLPLGKRCRDRS